MRAQPPNILGVGKIVINNTCSIDSLLTLLASSAADSDLFFKYLSNFPKGNNTIDIILQMVGNKSKQINYNRPLLVFQHFSYQQKTLITGTKMIDTMNTVTFMAEALLKSLPSYTRYSKCMNQLCHNLCNTSNSVVISINTINNDILLQSEIDYFLKTNIVKCKEENCFKRETSMNTSSFHLLIELTCIPQDKR